MSVSEDYLQTLTAAQLVEKLVSPQSAEEDVDLMLDWFLFTYSPEQAWDTVQASAEALKDPRLHKLIVTKVKDNYQPEIFLEAVNVVASLPGNEQAVAGLGTLSTIAIMMGRDEHHPRSQILGSKILASLALDAAVRHVIGSRGQLEKVVAAFVRHADNKEVVLECFKALANIAFRSKSNKDIMARLSVPEHVLKAITTHADDVRVVNEGLMTLRNVVGAPALDEKASLLVAKEVLARAVACKDVPEVQVNVLWNLVVLMSNRKGLKLQLEALGVLAHVFRALEAYPDNAYVQLPGVLSLALLSKVAPLRAKIAGLGTKGLTLLRKAFQTWTDDVDIARACLKTWMHLAYSPDIRKRMGSSGVLKEVAHSLPRHTECFPVLRAALLLFREMVKTPQNIDFLKRDSQTLSGAIFPLVATFPKLVPLSEPLWKTLAGEQVDEAKNKRETLAKAQGEAKARQEAAAKVRAEQEAQRRLREEEEAVARAEAALEEEKRRREAEQQERLQRMREEEEKKRRDEDEAKRKGEIEAEKQRLLNERNTKRDAEKAAAAEKRRKAEEDLARKKAQAAAKAGGAAATPATSTAKAEEEEKKAEEEKKKAEEEKKKAEEEKKKIDEEKKAAEAAKRQMEEERRQLEEERRHMEEERRLMEEARRQVEERRKQAEEERAEEEKRRRHEQEEREEEDRQRRQQEVEEEDRRRLRVQQQEEEERHRRQQQEEREEEERRRRREEEEREAERRRREQPAEEPTAERLARMRREREEARRQEEEEEERKRKEERERRAREREERLRAAQEEEERIGHARRQHDVERPRTGSTVVPTSLVPPPRGVEGSRSRAGSSALPASGDDPLERRRREREEARKREEEEELKREEEREARRREREEARKREEEEERMREEEREMRRRERLGAVPVAVAPTRESPSTSTSTPSPLGAMDDTERRRLEREERRKQREEEERREAALLEERRKERERRRQERGF